MLGVRSNIPVDRGESLRGNVSRLAATANQLTGGTIDPRRDILDGFGRLDDSERRSRPRAEGISCGARTAADLSLRAVARRRQPHLLTRLINRAPWRLMRGDRSVTFRP